MLPDIVPSSSFLSKYIQEQKLVVLFYFPHKLDRWFYTVDNVTNEVWIDGCTGVINISFTKQWFG